MLHRLGLALAALGTGFTLLGLLGYLSSTLADVATFGGVGAVGLGYLVAQVAEAAVDARERAAILVRARIDELTAQPVAIDAGRRSRS